MFGIRSLRAQRHDPDELKGRIDSRIPVLLAIQAWATPPVDWSTFENGHYVVAVGYDNDHFYFMDPSTLGHYTYIPIPEFLERLYDHDDYQKQICLFGIVMIKHDALLVHRDQVTRPECKRN
ncbi:C39 family peptidase [Candidatus Aalborgicola defluviihabitans]|uniref:C39 family peptidase n=1 Tax=Candidatus Aalborgicola defluviihabitans TaxID=3386187 RepID=UPI001EC7E055|nr:C39 family peptidase [Burkholderiales bacterium]